MNRKTIVITTYLVLFMTIFLLAYVAMKKPQKIEYEYQEVETPQPDSKYYDLEKRVEELERVKDSSL